MRAAKFELWALTLTRIGVKSLAEAFCLCRSPHVETRHSQISVASEDRSWPLAAISACRMHRADTSAYRHEAVVSVPDWLRAANAPSEYSGIRTG